MVRTVLVTGASSGLGLATAVHLAGMGFGVVGTARSDGKAAYLRRAADDAGVKVETAILDVTDASRCEALVAAVEPWATTPASGSWPAWRGRVVSGLRAAELALADRDAA